MGGKSKTPNKSDAEMAAINRENDEARARQNIIANTIVGGLDPSVQLYNEMIKQRRRSSGLTTAQNPAAENSESGGFL